MGSRDSLFAVEREGEDEIMRATVDCQCIFFGSLSSELGTFASLLKNGTPVVASQLCQGSGRGSHALNGVVTLKENDHLQLTSRGGDLIWDDGPNRGHLAFVVLDEDA